MTGMIEAVEMTVGVGMTVVMVVGMTVVLVVGMIVEVMVVERIVVVLAGGMTVVALVAEMTVVGLVAGMIVVALSVEVVVPSETEMTEGIREKTGVASDVIQEVTLDGEMTDVRKSLGEEMVIAVTLVVGVPGKSRDAVGVKTVANLEMTDPQCVEEVMIGEEAVIVGRTAGGMMAHGVKGVETEDRPHLRISGNEADHQSRTCPLTSGLPKKSSGNLVRSQSLRASLQLPKSLVKRKVGKRYDDAKSASLPEILQGIRMPLLSSS